MPCLQYLLNFPSFLARVVFSMYCYLNNKTALNDKSTAITIVRVLK